MRLTHLPKIGFMTLAGFILAGLASCGPSKSGPADTQNTRGRHLEFNPEPAAEPETKVIDVVEQILVEKIVSPDQGIPLTDAEAEDFLKTNCTSCHAKEGLYYSFWPQPEKLTATALETDLFRNKVYQSIYNMARGLQGAGQPAPMPPSVDDEESRAVAKRMISWYRSKIPGLALEADQEYSNEDSVVAGINYNFTCKTPLSIREFVFRFYQDAYSRNPVYQEIKEFGDPDAPVTNLVRRILSERISDKESPYSQEFIGEGLKKFAQKFSGANEIKSRDDENITAEIAADLKLEFYQKLLADSDTKSFREMLTSNTVMVSDKTAALYGAPTADCPMPAEGAWGPCKMQGSRETYWGTFGFLASKPTTFLKPSNNFGRSALMHFSIAGEVFLPATNGPKGDKINPLPGCFKSKDFRGDKQADGSVAPWGAAKVPQSGNICQSCHIARNLSVGSMMFRPFSEAGRLLTADLISVDDPMYGSLVDSNLGETKVWQDGADGALVPVTTEYLKSLLDFSETGEKGCIPEGNADRTDKPITGLLDLANYMMGDSDKNISNGLARHLPRSLSNLSLTTSEITIAIESGLEASGGKISAAFEAYFKSETFACKIDSSTDEEEVTGE